MPGSEQLRSLEEMARLGAEVFERRVRTLLRPEDDGKFVALDIGTREYEVDGDDYTAVSLQRARAPAAEVWLARAGEPAAYRIGRQ